MKARDEGIQGGGRGIVGGGLLTQKIHLSFRWPLLAPGPHVW